MILLKRNLKYIFYSIFIVFYYNRQVVFNLSCYILLYISEKLMGNLIKENEMSINTLKWGFVDFMGSPPDTI